MAAVYKVGKKWRADWTDNNNVRHRKRFPTKGAADDHLTDIKQQIKEGIYVAPSNIPTFGALADEWVDDRIAQSKEPGTGYRPSSLQQWQSHVAHIKACVGQIKGNCAVSAVPSRKQVH